MSIHKTAIIDSSVEMDSSVTVGPYAVIKGDTKISKNTIVHGHAHVGSRHGSIEIGEENEIYPCSVLGGAPQDLKYKKEPTKLVIGNKNLIREHVTINIGTPQGRGVTVIGDNNLLMSYVHIAHDCEIGSSVVISNSSQIAGHVHIGDGSILSGCCAVVQNVRIGKLAYVSNNSVANKDLMPFGISDGFRYAKLKGTNKIGLKRNGFSEEEIKNIDSAIRIFLKSDLTAQQAIKEIESYCKKGEKFDYFLEFIKASKTGFYR